VSGPFLALADAGKRAGTPGHQLLRSQSAQRAGPTNWAYVLAKSPGAGEEEMQLPIPGKKGEGDGSGKYAARRRAETTFLSFVGLARRVLKTLGNGQA
jgi:hypothetical protein